MELDNEVFDVGFEETDDEFDLDFGEVIEVTTSDFNKLKNRPSYADEIMTGETNIPEVPDAVSDLENDLKYQTETEVEDYVNNAVAAEANARDSAIEAAINAEATARINTDESLQNAINDESSARTAADVSLQGAIDEEANARATKDDALQTAIDNEISNRESADSAINTRIDNEAAARENADNNMNAAIAAETTAREDADNTLSTALSNEITARESADNTINAALAAETSAREGADNTLNTAITTESTARENEDIHLQSQIDAISASSDVTDIVGTYAELQAYDTTTLRDKDIIKVLEDESRNDEVVYYRWSTSDNDFSMIGEEGPYYTRSQTDTLLSGKQNKLTAGDNITLVGDKISAKDTTYTAGDNISIDGNKISATDTTYTAGNGIKLDNTTFSADTDVLATQTDLDSGLATKQNKLTAGDNITINGDTISAKDTTYSAGDNVSIDENNKISAKDTTYTAGNAISISGDDTISADIYPADFFTGDPTTSASGTEIELKDVIGLESVSLKGDTEQKKYSGKNLVNIKGTLMQSNATAIVNGQSITVTSTDTANTARVEVPVNYEANRQMTISFDAACLEYEPTGNYSVMVYMRSGSTVAPGASITRTAGETRHYSVTFTPTVSDMRLWLYVKSSNMAGVASYRFDNIQIEYGSTATDYEPYVGATPSPNPDYPQVIETVTGRQVVDVYSRNLFNVNNPLEYRLISRGGWVTSSDLYNNFEIEVSGGEKWTTNWSNKVGSALVRHVEYDENGNYVTGDSNDSAKTMAFNSKTRKVIFSITQSDSNHFEDLQIEFGSVATPYQTHQSYEINLGKNLFDNTKSPFNASMATATVTSNTIRVTSTRTETSTANIFDYVIYKTVRVDDYIDKPVTLSVGETTPSLAGNQRLTLGLCDADGSNRVSKGYIAASNGRLTYTPTSNDYGRYIFVALYAISGKVSPAGSYVDYENVQLELGSAATTYAPYFEPIELCNINGYQDCIYKNNDNWYVQKKTGKYIFTGIENWYMQSNYSTANRILFNYNIKAVIDKYMGKRKGISNNFTFHNTTLQSTNVDVTAFNFHEQAQYSTNLYVKIERSRLVSEDASGFKKWLSNNNMTVYYQLAEPIDTLITNTELIAQLEALRKARMYDDTTYIKSTSENLPAILGVEAFNKTLGGMVKIIRNVLEES